VSGAYVDAGAARAAIVSSAFFAWLAVPFLVAHLVSAERSLRASLAYAFLIGVVGAVLLRDAGLDKTSMIVAALVVAAVVGDLLRHRALPEQVRGAIARLATQAREWLSTPMRRL